MFETQINQVLKCPCCEGENFDTILKLDSEKRINLFIEYSKKYYQNFLINICWSIDHTFGSDFINQYDFDIIYKISFKLYSNIGKW